MGLSEIASANTDQRKIEEEPANGCQRTRKNLEVNATWKYTPLASRRTVYQHDLIREGTPYLEITLLVISAPF
jgi:hypothetical protein